MVAKEWPQREWINSIFGLIDGKTMDSTQKVWFSEGIDRCFNYCFFFLFCLKVFNRKLPIDAWKTSIQSRCMLQWREAVFHGTMDCCCSCQRRTSTDKSFYLVVSSKKQKRRHCRGRASERICKCTRNWLDQMTTTNRIILSQALIIIRSKRNTFIIRN